MNKTVKTKAVKMLRHGKYKQVTGTLCKALGRRHYAYCVLGVIGRAAGIQTATLLAGTESSYKAIEQAAGIPPKTSMYLYGLNDTKKKSLRELAAVVETL